MACVRGTGYLQYHAAQRDINGAALLESQRYKAYAWHTRARDSRDPGSFTAITAVLHCHKSGQCTSAATIAGSARGILTVRSAAMPFF